MAVLLFMAPAHGLVISAVQQRQMERALGLAAVSALSASAQEWLSLLSQPQTSNSEEMQKFPSAKKKKGLTSRK